MENPTKKTEFLQIRITKEDKAAIKKVAKSKGMTVTELICSTFLDEKAETGVKK